MEKNNETFLKIAAAYNCGGADNVTDLECDAPFAENDIVKSHQAQADFGGKLEETIDGVRLFVRANYQVRAGLRRGDLFIADFGDYRLVAFTGEGVIKDAA